MLPHPAADELTLTGVLAALSDPVRLGIVRQVADAGPTEVICQEVGGEMPKSTRSHHLKALREAGVIRTVPQGRQRVVTLRADDLDKRFPGLLAAVLEAAPDPAGDGASSAGAAAQTT